MIENGKRLPLYFQDPCYSKLDIEFLTMHIGAEVVDDPDAFSLTDETTILLNLDPVYRYMGQWIADGIWPSALIGYDWVAQDKDYRGIQAVEKKEKTEEQDGNKSKELPQETPGNVTTMDTFDIMNYHTEDLDTMFAKYQRVPLWDEYPFPMGEYKTDRLGKRRSGHYISLWVRKQDLDSDRNVLRGKGKENAEIAVRKWLEHINELGPGWRKRREEEYVKQLEETENDSESKSEGGVDSK
jgi:hypothetical protein